MKKNLLPIIFLLSILFGNVLKAQTPTISTGPSNLCINTTGYVALTNSVPTAATYSWVIATSSCVLTQTSSNTSINVTYPCCGTFTISCYAFSSGMSFITQLTKTVSVACNPAPVIAVMSSPNGSICGGSSATLSAAGATSYTWIPGNLSGPSIVVNPTTSTCYTVIGTSSSGCNNITSSCLSVTPTYSMSISGNTAICLGNSSTFNLSGGPSFVTNPGNIISSNPVLTPTASTIYTISCPVGAYPCPSSSVIPVIIVPIPTINVSNASSSSNTICAGSSATLFAIGNAITYTWSTMANTNSIVVNPIANTCYSVAGYNANGCINMAVYCFSVLPSPSLTLSGTNTVCLGSSTTLTVSGANSYTWAVNSSTANTLNVLPTSTSAVSGNVYGTGNNGCNNFASYTVNALNSCANVWPGDANRDGVVSALDVLELGLGAFSTGAARSSTSNAWASQYANAWVGTVSTGWNLAHADCNGDGTINASDLIAITNNFSLTHAFKENSTSVNPDIKISANPSLAISGAWNKVDIELGDATNVINQLYGITFEINYDKNMVQTDSVKINYTSSFLSANNQNINFQKSQFVNGKQHAATVRVDHNNVNGNGKVAEFWFKLKTNLVGSPVINISATNAKKISTAGALSNLNNDAGLLLNIENNLTSIIEKNGLNTLVRIQPNPSNSFVELSSDLSTTVQYQICDISGRLILKGEFTNSQVLDVSRLNAGTYFVHFEGNQSHTYKKLLIEK